MAGRMETGANSGTRPVPEHILAPDYAATGIPGAKLPRAQWMIDQHSPADIELARIAGRISREVLDEAGKAVAVGVTTDEIDRVVHEETIKRGAYPSPLNYHGFPRSVCTSINEVVCHGIPEKRTVGPCSLAWARRCAQRLPTLNQTRVRKSLNHTPLETDV